MDTADLTKLSTVFERASMVCTLEEVHCGRVDPLVIGLRHDVDDNNDPWNSALAMARWEYARGYRSTYYFLHDTKYWGPQMRDGLHEIASMGHEIGLHNNALAVGRRKNRDPFEILHVAVDELRHWSGTPVLSTASHGDRDCQYGGFINYQLFQESYSPHVLDNYKRPAELGFTPRPLKDFGFKFQGDWLPRPYYLTDSGGAWGNYADPVKWPFVVTLDRCVEGYPFDGQLIVLQHPDWWPVGLYA